MTNKQIQNFATRLAEVNSEKEAIEILKQYKFWDDDKVWKEYGNNPINYSTIGNQQSSADNALVEKLINSVDAVLMKECLKRSIKPDGSEAPHSMAEAQERFFGIHRGKLSSIDERQRTLLAQNILLVATGSKSKPCFSIIDRGEGQTPDRIPETLLSLTQGNKIKVPFVQGKFGMGGSGVLRFCSSEHKIKLLISKRDPNIDSSDDSKDFWGVTVVRREEPKEGMRSSHFTYLAPDKKILKFKADKLKLLPGDYPNAFGDYLESGTFIKLFEYEIGPGLKTLIQFDLYYRLSLLMPGIALPIRLYERRKGYSANSFETTLAGLNVRLDEDRNQNLEIEFQTPSTGEMVVDGQKIDYSIYVFKKGKKDNYAKSEGIVFSINGQAHGFLPKTFFERKSVGMSYLADSILIMVECSNISRRKQEELFMPSRDRLAETAFRFSIEKELEDILKNHAGLRDLQNRRRKEAIENKLQDSKPLVNILENIIKKSPSLSNLFLRGIRIKNPFDLREVSVQANYNGKRFPTYFRATKKYPKDNPKSCHINGKFRIQFETDVENNYFNRDIDKGEFILKFDGEIIKDYSLNLWNGLATTTISLPKGANLGVILNFEVEVTDSTRIEPLKNLFYVQVTEEQEIVGSGGDRKLPPSDKKGEDRKKESYLDVPNVVEIRKEDWNNENYKDFGFNEFSALKVRSIGDASGHDFFINMDNSYLKMEMKVDNKTEPAVLEARYRYGMVLLGISILDFEENRRKKAQNEASGRENLLMKESVSVLTEAVAPALLPMISSLGSPEFEF